MWRFMRGLVAGPPTDPFLYQLQLVRTPWLGVYLHVILRPDEPDPHDHPWNFASVILSGSYTERVYPDKHDPRGSLVRGRVRFSLARTRLQAAHRVTAVDGPVWTLVFAGRERNPGWGFYPDGKFVPWRTYQQREI